MKRATSNKKVLRNEHMILIHQHSIKQNNQKQMKNPDAINIFKLFRPNFSHIIVKYVDYRNSHQSSNNHHNYHNFR